MLDIIGAICKVVWPADPTPPDDDYGVTYGYEPPLTDAELVAVRHLIDRSSPVAADAAGDSGGEVTADLPRTSPPHSTDVLPWLREQVTSHRDHANGHRTDSATALSARGYWRGRERALEDVLHLIDYAPILAPLLK